MEEWRDIPGYEGEYQVSDQGGVRSLARYVNSGLSNNPQRFVRDRLLSQFPDKDGYLMASLRAKGRRVHQLVLLAFVGPCPDECEGAHNNGIKANNTLRNLRYATSQQNADDRVKHGTQVRGVEQHKAKLTPELVGEIRAARGRVRQVDLAAMFNVAQSTISAIQLGKSWGCV